ncbi:hypothetical protein [Nonomuraea sp. SYSU D8015]|uniref:hypothetical protein n=1 Tax=Nonomuraea sp. SYSU D8015 TaxID=2593644 RepID=UPI0016617A37|nr:hypothetical protein [Nonomuraea sp. SYSU D8015]
MGYVLAADGGGLPYQLAQARKGKAAYFAPGTQWLTSIHPDDAVEFILRAVADVRRGRRRYPARRPPRRTHEASQAGYALVPPPSKTPAGLCDHPLTGPCESAPTRPASGSRHGVSVAVDGQRGTT